MTNRELQDILAYLRNHDAYETAEKFGITVGWAEQIAELLENPLKPYPKTQ